MKRLIVFLFPAVLLAACHHEHLVSNKYKDAKVHPSETLAKEDKKADKDAKKTFKKQMKRNQKTISKNGRPFSKKGKKVKSPSS